ncbi:MAG TPA: hypothetical protein VJH03_02475 [Blastocatellia bacterium]|nr:hypothetical protein [Blastocatellia bacterium]
MARDKNRTPIELESPRYTVALASRLTGLGPDRIRRWVRGYTYEYHEPVTGEARLITKTPVLLTRTDQGDPFVSFLELIDLLFIKKFLDQGVSLQRLRSALNEATVIVGRRHFAEQIFFTDGRSIYLKVRDNPKADSILQLLSGGQWVIAPVIRQIAKQIDFDEALGFAERWYPLGRKRPIVIDPLVSFGAPSILGKGVRTTNVYDMFLAEGKRSTSVAQWLDLDELEIDAAVEFETQLKAA